LARRTEIVTGGAGFIGSHLVDALLADGARVVVVDDLSSGTVDRVGGDAELEQVDISDAEALDEVVDAARPATIYHLAAQASVTASVADPQRDATVNVIGTLNVLQAARRHGAPVVFTSTGGALYGDEAPLPTTEDFPPEPLSPYGASKLAGESYMGTWRRSDGLAHTVLRLGNVYGPRQSPHGEAGVVAIFSRLLLEGRTPTLYGEGSPTRDYVHVEDVVQAAISSRGVGGTYNIPTGVAPAVVDLLAVLQDAAGTSLEPELAPLRAGELKRSRLDASRAQEAFGWRPQIAVEDGLRSTFRWFQERFER
jgi:UDP-glucose 4-epimerase